MKLTQMFRTLFLAGILLLGSCSADNDLTGDIDPVHISVSFSGFNITTSPMTRGQEGDGTLPEHLNRCALKVFDADGTMVKSFSQKRESTQGSQGEPSFGSASFNLAPGTYTFVGVLNEAKGATTEALAAIEPATIISSTEASLPGNYVFDTYCCSKTVTIDATTRSVTLDMGSRINSRFKLTITDVPPEAVSKVQVVIAPESSAPTGSISFNPSTGLATTQQYYRATRDISNHTAATSDIVFDILPSANPLTTGVLLNALDDATPTPNKLYYRELTAVVFIPNRITHATGKLFVSDTQVFSIGVSNPWSQTEKIEF